MRPELKRRVIISISIVVVCLAAVFWPRAVDESDKAHPRPRSASERIKDFISYKQIKEDLAANIHLGLDLKGGTHLVMLVKWQDVIHNKVLRNIAQARTILQRENIPFTDIKDVSTPNSLGELSVLVPDSSRNSDIESKLLDDFNKNTLTGKGWARIGQSATSITFQMNQAEQDQIADKATTDAMGVINTRINALGVSEPSIQLGPQGSHQIILQLPGVDDPERVKNILKAESET